MATRTVYLASHISAVVKLKSRMDAPVKLDSKMPAVWRGKSEIASTVVLHSRIG
jgi:hypothetical protein